MGGQARRSIVVESILLGSLVGGAASALAGFRLFTRDGFDLFLLALRPAVDAAILGALAFFLATLPPFHFLRKRCSSPKLAAVIAAGVFLAVASVVSAWVLSDPSTRAALGRSLATSSLSAPLQLLVGSRPLTFLKAELAVGGIVIGALALTAAIRSLAAGLRLRPRLDRAHALALAVFATVNLMPELAGGGDGRPRAVVLVVIDALRADHLGAHGYPRNTTPALDRLARDSVVFTQAISQSTFTKASIASLLTGRNPHEHGVYRGTVLGKPGAVEGDVLPLRETTLGEMLSAAGYLTGAWVRNKHLVVGSGLEQGFRVFHDASSGMHEINARAEAWLRGTSRARPTFTYLHYLELHDPYRPPPSVRDRFGDCSATYERLGLFDGLDWHEFARRVRNGTTVIARGDVEGIKSCYDAQLSLIDAEIGRVLDWLRASRLYDRSMLVVTSDHGEGFVEHGFLSHSNVPYDELIRVPLVVKLPDQRFAGIRIDRQVRHIDIVPTILELAGIDPPSDLDGQSLIALAESGGRAPFPEVAVAEFGGRDSLPVVAVRTARWKYIFRPERPAELYDLAIDPAETVNRLPERKQEARDLEAIALRVVEKSARVLAERAELSPETVESLRALGYVAGE